MAVSPNANFCILNFAALCSMGKLRVRVEIQNLICLLVFNLGIKRDKWTHTLHYFTSKIENRIFINNFTHCCQVIDWSTNNRLNLPTLLGQATGSNKMMYLVVINLSLLSKVTKIVTEGVCPVSRFKTLNVN